MGKMLEFFLTSNAGHHFISGSDFVIARKKVIHGKWGLTLLFCGTCVKAPHNQWDKWFQWDLDVFFGRLGKGIKMTSLCPLDSFLKGKHDSGKVHFSVCQDCDKALTIWRHLQERTSLTWLTTHLLPLFFRSSLNFGSQSTCVTD